MMKTHWLLVISCVLATNVAAQHANDFHLRPRPQVMSDYPVFTQDDLTQIAKQGATLEQINLRLSICDDNIKEIRKKLDDGIMPTIHVFDFLKWLIGAILLAVVGIVIKDYFARRTPSPPVAPSQP